MSLLFKLGLGTLAVTAAVRTAAAAGALVVYTPSVPVGLYWQDVAGTPSVAPRNTYACLPVASSKAPAVLRDAALEGAMPEEWKRHPLVKRVIGVAGDVVTYDPAKGVHINGVLWPESLRLAKDEAGHPLPSPTFPVVLGPGEVWLASEHPRGFDSRYFGAVRVEALSCSARPVWTW